MKQRTSAIAVAGLALVLPLAACSSSKPTGSGANNTAAANPSAPAASAMVAPPKASKNYNLQFIQGVTGDQFYITMQCGVEAEAAKLGVTVKTQGPQKFDPTLQKPILDSVVATKPDAILIAPTDVKAMQTPLKVAADKGIKVVLVDTTLSDPSGAVSQISSDNVAGGAEAFKAIQQLVPGGGEVLVVNVKPGISTTDQRQQGFADAAKADPKFKYVGTQFDQDQASTAAQVTLAALQKNPGIVGIFAANLFSAEGAATGVRQAGKSGKVKIVGFDAEPDEVQALQQGTVQALIAQSPYTIGTDAVDQAYAALTGKTTTPKIGTKFTIITKDNMNSPEAQQAIYKTSC